jgi:hypothetical protein
LVAERRIRYHIGKKACVAIRQNERHASEARYSATLDRAGVVGGRDGIAQDAAGAKGGEADAENPYRRVFAAFDVKD